MNNTTHDEYGFPLVYEKTALAQMQAKISLPAETIELIPTGTIDRKRAHPIIPPAE